jgi:Histidine kinase/Histidine kinase-, DNA gyrase B-, and HSP90-like ATPase
MTSPQSDPNNSAPHSAPTPASGLRQRAEPFLQQFLRGYHRYAAWLVTISWKRFTVLAILLIAMAAIVQSLPPFSYKVTEWVDEPIELPELPSPPKPPNAEKKPTIKIESEPSTGGKGKGVDISIGEDGIRIRANKAAAPASVGAPEAPAAPAAAAAPAAPAVSDSAVTINLPSSATKEIVQEAIEEARRAVQDAAQARREAQQAAEEAKRGAQEVQREAEELARSAQETAREALEDARRALKDAGLSGATRKVKKTRTVHWGDFLTDLALIWILGSIIIKATYKGRMQAEVKAAQATETAESEALKRQVVEARMAAMQAQIEPHFLFNTLASIDHLIETDPQRASLMQKNLIALLRASMPTMRETQDTRAPRDLGRELALIRPYLEILKVRMEERLQTVVDVPDGLLSAEFPAMMIQTLVENAIKHGLEPKPEGGSLTVKAEIVHGKLAVSVADTGLGFGKAATAGTGVGLANIRERLQLLYGPGGSFTVAENQPCGTVVTVSVPYRTVTSGASGALA